MAIGTTSSFDPVTGQTRSSQFEYMPAPPPDPMEQYYKQLFSQLNPPPPQPQGPTPFWENPRTYYPPRQQINPIQQVQAAQQLISQAMQYQGIRGYQRDLESGKSAAEAMAKWGPMLFANDSRGFGPSMKALTPAPTVPQMEWKPYNPQTGEPAHWSNTRSVVQPTAGSAYRSDVNPDENFIEREGNKYYVNRRTGAITKLSEGGKPSEYDLIDYRLAAEKAQEANKALLDPYISRNPQARTNALESLKEAQEVLSGMRKQSGKSMAPPSAPTAPVTAETAAAPQTKPQTASPYKEGTRLRDKTTGKMYRVVNGQPVPE